MNTENYDSLCGENVFFERLYHLSDTIDDMNVSSAENEEIIYEDRIGENIENVSQEYAIMSIKTVFEENLMNTHLQTIQFLDRLDGVELLMYYRAVSDSVAIRKILNKDCRENLITPQELCESAQKENEMCMLSIRFECIRTDLRILKKLLNYIRNNKFLVVSDRFYSDSEDVHMFFKVQSDTGYYLELEVVIKCQNEYEAENMIGTLSENESL